MPKIKRASKALAAAEVLAVLARLAHNGAYVVNPQGEGVDGCALYSPRNNFSEPVSHVSQQAIAHGVRKGWLAPDADGSVLRVSAAGLRALRTAKSGGRAPPVSKHARRKDRHPGTRAEGALDWLRRRRDKDGKSLITQVQYNAGEQLAADFWHAQMSPRITASWSAVAPSRRMRRAVPGFGVEMHDAVLAARFQRALDAVGPELADILVDVCCHDMGLEASGRISDWPERAAKVVLDLALTRLARHYGLLAPERPAAGRLRHWGDADYRPTLETWR